MSIRVLAKSFCFGAFVALLLQAVSFSAVWVMHKKWGKNARPDESAALFNWTLYLLIHADSFFCALIGVGCVIMMMTRKGYSALMYYMCKKFDNDADAPTSESVWTPRFLFVNVIGFRFGYISGSYYTWVIVEIALGMPAPIVPLLCSLLVDVGFCCLMLKCFDWAHEEPSTADDDDDDKLEEDSSLPHTR